ncbi:MAG: hypothetical protein AB1918_10975 [Pseudomonadota bacterium]
MGGGGAMDDDYSGYTENPAEANNAEFGPEGDDLRLPSLAGGVATSATDPEDARRLCEDLRNAENLDDDDFHALVRMVGDIRDWDIGEDRPA